LRQSFLVFGSPRIEEDEIQEVVDSLRSGWIGTGPKVAKFEEMFREYVGSRYAVAVHSCTAALHLSLIASGVKAGSEVITSPMTFAATANAIIHTGATPVFADIKRSSLNIDPEEIKKKLTPATRAILPVHFAGRACEMSSILKIAERADAIVVNDAAHAIETEYCGKKISQYGAMTAYSFYATKNIVTGEGGMVVTDDKEIADKIKIYALHGMTKDAWKRFSDEGYKHYEVVFPGYKYNMMDIQAGIGFRQLGKIEAYSVRRKEIWNLYNEAFKDLPVIVPSPVEPNTRHAFHLYTLLVDLEHLTITRDQFMDLLFRENIGTGVHYTALHLHPYYRNRYGYQRGDFPNTEFVADRTVSLPLSAKLTDEDVDDVINAASTILKSHTRG
jgi:dTDP-4-amino-4,6-dideoxygalactose transaminase